MPGKSAPPNASHLISLKKNPNPLPPRPRPWHVNHVSAHVRVPPVPQLPRRLLCYAKLPRWTHITVYVPLLLTFVWKYKYFPPPVLVLCTMSLDTERGKDPLLFPALCVCVYKHTHTQILMLTYAGVSLFIRVVYYDCLYPKVKNVTL